MHGALIVLGEKKIGKDDFQVILQIFSTLMFINIVSSHLMECESMSFVTKHIPYL